MNQRHHTEKMVEAWILELTNQHEWNAQKLTSLAHSLGISCELQRNIFLVEIEDIQAPHSQDLARLIDFQNNYYELKERISRKIETLLDTSTLFTYVEDGVVLIATPFIGNEKESRFAKDIQNKLHGMGLQIGIGIGKRYSGIEGYRKSYFQARQSLELSKKMKMNQRISHIEAWGLTRLLYEVSKPTQEEFIQPYMEKLQNMNIEMHRTLEVFLESNLDVKFAAQKLFIHRNTLQYRLDKISNDLQLDCKCFNDAILLRVMLTFYRLLKFFSQKYKNTSRYIKLFGRNNNESLLRYRYNTLNTKYNTKIKNIILEGM